MKRSKSPAPAKAAKEVREVEVKMEDADILRAGAAKLVGVLAITMIVAAAALYVFHEQHRKSTHTCVKLFSLFGDATSCTVKFGPASHHDEYFLGVLGLFLIWAMYAMEASAEYALSLVGLIAWWTFSFCEFQSMCASRPPPFPLLSPLPPAHNTNPPLFFRPAVDGS
jgi:hypothetical protein